MQIAQDIGMSEAEVEAVLENNDYFIQEGTGYYSLSIFRPLRWGVAGVGKIRCVPKVVHEARSCMLRSERRFACALFIRSVTRSLDAAALANAPGHVSAHPLFPAVMTLSQRQHSCRARS